MKVKMVSGIALVCIVAFSSLARNDAVTVAISVTNAEAPLWGFPALLPELFVHRSIDAHGNPTESMLVGRSVARELAKRVPGLRATEPDPSSAFPLALPYSDAFREVMLTKLVELVINCSKWTGYSDEKEALFHAISPGISSNSGIDSKQMIRDAKFAAYNLLEVLNSENGCVALEKTNFIEENRNRLQSMIAETIGVKGNHIGNANLDHFIVLSEILHEFLFSSTGAWHQGVTEIVEVALADVSQTSFFPASSLKDSFGDIYTTFLDFVAASFETGKSSTDLAIALYGKCVSAHGGNNAQKLATSFDFRACMGREDLNLMIADILGQKVVIGIY